MHDANRPAAALGSALVNGLGLLALAGLPGALPATTPCPACRPLLDSEGIGDRRRDWIIVDPAPLPPSVEEDESCPRVEGAGPPALLAGERLPMLGLLRRRCFASACGSTRTGA